MSGTISNVGGNVHVGDNINYVINFVKMTADPVLPDHYISLSNSQNVSVDILERRYLLDQFQQLIDSGKCYIVLHGSEGIGKTTFLSVYYNAATAQKYQQKGWFNFQGRLPETYVQELTKGTLERPSDITSWVDFYYNQARREVRELNIAL
ncbi:MAG: hypothetical protein HC892_21050 [Saprospiraceae bacterium]|nr:hypothetical protein [Saprospiraceae bacterium]